MLSGHLVCGCFCIRGQGHEHSEWTLSLVPLSTGLKHDDGSAPACKGHLLLSFAGIGKTPLSLQYVGTPRSAHCTTNIMLRACSL